VKRLDVKVFGMGAGDAHAEVVESEDGDLVWHDEAQERIDALEAELERLRADINTPQTVHFLSATSMEASHQRQRWGVEHDAGKADADWFWLVGYLAGKALQPGIDLEKKLHRVVAAAAALLNWHAHASGADKRMRPGIAPPNEDADAG
jgi:hypothetical protein